jgi:hypothetical protein
MSPKIQLKFVIFKNTFNDTHERARHFIQHIIELFANKFNLILMDPWGGHSL